MRLSLRVLLALTIAGAVVLLLARRPRSEFPNVVLVTVDTLRPDHLGGYGYPRGTSPGIDRLLAAGTSFRTAIVPRGQTWPTLASVLTSQYPVTHGVRKNGLRLRDGAVTLAHVLADEGYRCGAALANSGAAEWPGFHETFSARGRDRRTAEAAREWIRSNAAGRFFLWVHLFAPHRPFDPPAELAERFDPGYGGPVDGSIEQIRRISERGERPDPRGLRHLIALYDGEVRFVDRLVADVLTEVREAGVSGRTIVVFTADHGEELCERGSYVSHSASIYDSVLRAPLAVSWPGRVPAGAWREEIVEAIDVAPTVLELAGVEAPAGFAGRSLVPLIRGEKRPAADHVAFSELEDRVVSLRTPRFRYVHNPTDFDFPLSADDPDARYPIAAEELYALDVDPGERVNVAASRAADADRLRAMVRRWESEHDWEAAGRRFRDRAVDPGAAEALDALGYLP